jgi:aspartate/methionine/tyrosine aminotransferase
MASLPAFRLEEHFSTWEFRARYNLTASDAETMPMRDLLEMASDEDRQAWEELTLGYIPTFGTSELREAIADTFGPEVGPGAVVTFAGAEEGLYLAMQVLLGPDDHAVVITPNYQAAESVPLSLCEVTGIALDPERDWLLDLDELDASLRPSTKVVSVNFPHNPTGTLPSQEDFDRLTDLCEERGIYLFCDEVYRGVELDPARTLPQAVDLAPNALSLGVTSKALGLPGLRVGWIACRSPEVIAALERAKHYTSICNAGPSEVLATIALHHRETILTRNREIIATNAALFDAFVDDHPGLFDWRAPDGGCVAFPRYTGPGDVEDLCHGLVEEAGVLLLPASIYRSELTPTPVDRFRVGLGRRGTEPALAAFANWLSSSPRRLGS